MSKILTPDPEPMFAAIETPDEIEPGEDPAFDALLRSFELEHAPAKSPRLVPFPAPRRDPYYLD